MEKYPPFISFQSSPTALTLAGAQPTCIAGLLNGDSRTQSAIPFIQAYAAKLELSEGYSFALDLLRFQIGSQAPTAAMSAVLQCIMAVACALSCHGLTDVPNQWHEAVMAELGRLLSEAQERSSLASSIQTGDKCSCCVFSS